MTIDPRDQTDDIRRKAGGNRRVAGKRRATTTQASAFLMVWGSDVSQSRLLRDWVGSDVFFLAKKPNQSNLA